jgi:predicted Zn-dependent protease
MHLSITFEANGLLEEGLVYSRKYHQENPDDIRGHYNYAAQLVRRDSLDRGIQELEKLMVTSPYFPWTYQTLIVIHERAGEHAKTYRVLKKMFGVYSRNPRPFWESLDENDLMTFLEALHRSEVDKGDEAAAEAVRKALEATALHFNTSSR